MAAFILANGRQSYADTDGLPLVGGKLYTFSAGTSTPKTTWADADQVAANTNPIILDSRGEAAVFWLGSYKVVLKDADDNLIWTVDDIEAVNVDSTVDAAIIALEAEYAATTGASLVGFTKPVRVTSTMTTVQQALTALIDGEVDYLPASGGTDAGVKLVTNGTLGSFSMGGTDPAPTNDEGGVWATITTILGRSPNITQDMPVYAAAFGRNGIPFAEYSAVFGGHDNIAFGVASAVGGAGSATGDPANPITGKATFLGYCALAFGKVALALGQTSIALGERVKALTRSAVALGYQAIAQGSLGAFAVGNDVQTSTGGDWSTAIGLYLRNTGLGASNIGSGVNPGSPSDNDFAGTLGLGITVLRPPLILAPGTPGDSYSGKVYSRTGWRSLGANGGSLNLDFGGVYHVLTNSGSSGSTKVQLTARKTGTETTVMEIDGINGVAFIPNGTAPVGSPTGGGYWWVESGALKYRGSSGTVTTIAPA